MKLCRVMLLAFYASATAAAQEQVSICERIQRWDNQIADRQAAIARLLTRYSEQHPEVASWRRDLASAEAARAADAEKAKLQGAACSSSATRETSNASEKKSDATKSGQQRSF